MSKFKVGDKVRIVGWKESVSAKVKFYGTIAVISEVRDRVLNEYQYSLNPKTGFNWRDEELELANNHKIVIITEGNTTIARLYENNKVIKTAEAKCSPEDTFDFTVGAKLAYNRLMGKPCATGEPPKPKYYNGKVVCIKSGYPWWTVGKVYEVKDGVIIANDGEDYPGSDLTPYIDAEDIRHAGRHNNTKHNPKNEFIPFVES